MQQQLTVNPVVSRALPALLLVAAVVIVFAPVAGIACQVDQEKNNG